MSVSSVARSAPSQMRVKRTSTYEHMLSMTPDTRYMMASEGRVHFKNTDIPGNKYRRLRADGCSIRGNDIVCFGDRNHFYGDNITAYGNDIILSGSNCIAHGVRNVDEGVGNRLLDADGVLYPGYEAAAQAPIAAAAAEPKPGVQPNTSMWKLWPGDIEGESRPSPTSRLDCCVCMTNGKDVLFEPCGHLTCCRKCTRDLANNHAMQVQCPQCRAPVKFFRVIYY
jgi:hypothetical protein